MNMFENSKSQIENAAHEWFMLITSDAATDADIEAFEAWRDGSPAHSVAYAGISQVWNELGILADFPQGENLRQSVRAVTGTENIFAKFLCAVQQKLSLPYYVVASLMVVMGMFVFMQDTPALIPDIYQTTTSEVREITLADGSIITLGALSRVEVLYRLGRRNILLKEGQAFFDVVKNTAKPFYVTARDTEVRVLGTKFDVHLGPEEITVGVLEGQVRVTPKQTEKRKFSAKVLTAGEIISAAASGFTEDITKAEVKPGAWRKGRIVYKKAPFARIIADANRYYAGHIVLEDESLADVHVTILWAAR